MSTPETVIPSSQITATITAAALARYRDDALPDDVYARVADKLAEASREDSSAVRVIEDGVSAPARWPGSAFRRIRPPITSEPPA
jgi:hypothetical protein